MKINTITRRMTALALGLGLVVAAHAETVDGEVRKIDAEAGKITVKHGEIKSIDMPPMQMSYRVSDPSWLTKVQPGDKIRFSADKVNGQYTITTLEKK